MHDTVILSEEDAETIISFIKNHEWKEIPNVVWDVCMKLIDQIDC